MPAPFPESQIFTDLEIDDIISSLRLRLAEKGCKAERVSVERKLYPRDHRLYKFSGWGVVVKIGDKYVVGTGETLAEALNELVEKAVPPLDCLAYLGYTDYPLSNEQ